MSEELNPDIPEEPEEDGLEEISLPELDPEIILRVDELLAGLVE